MLYLRNMETNEPTLVYLEEAPARTVVESCSGERYIRTHQGGWISSEGRRVSSDYLEDCADAVLPVKRRGYMELGMTVSVRG